MRTWLRRRLRAGGRASCHGSTGKGRGGGGTPKVAIVGAPNVGKSVVFNQLTGKYVTVSNYPGTTVEIAAGKGQVQGGDVSVFDTPGMYSMFPITDDERAARAILLEMAPDVVVHVVDAKNLELRLPLTLQLLDAGFRVVLDLNMSDEAERAGVRIDVSRLERELGIGVVETVATSGEGIGSLRAVVAKALADSEVGDGLVVRFDTEVEAALSAIVERLRGEHPLSPRMLGLLLLQGDAEIWERVRSGGGDYDGVLQVVRGAEQRFNHSLSYDVAMRYQKAATTLTERTVQAEPVTRLGFGERLSRILMRPLTGIPILLLILYVGLYQFVGVFGAQTLVDFLEGTVFRGFVNPAVEGVVLSHVPSEPIQQLLVGEYGVVTLGVTYAVALILPIVATFFLAFSILEDSGYLPRLAMLIDRVFKAIGLNGRAVIPMVLGFGCATMATLVTKTLETKREKMISTMLLALAIPCSAQLGVIFAMLSVTPSYLLIWGGSVLSVFMLIGFLASRLMPGERPYFYMEMPPLRLHKLSNVLVKTYSRVQWYFLEVFPLFVLASVMIWVGQLTGVFDVIVKGLEAPTMAIGLPSEVAVAFLFGFFRRDYGASGLYHLSEGGALAGSSLVVAAVTLTLFMPCVAQFSVMAKQRGLKTAVAMALFIFPFAFAIGFLLNSVLTVVGV